MTIAMAVLGGFLGGAAAFLLWVWAIERQLKHHKIIIPT